MRLHRSLVSAALFFFFLLAFVAAPYWLVAESLAERIVSLLITLSLAALWARLSSNEMEVCIQRQAWVSAAILLGLMSALNFRALTSAIPWMGDEGYHIKFALSLAKLFPTIWLLSAALASAGLLFIVWRKPRYAVAACAVLVVGCIGVYLLRQPAQLELILRYPFFSRWFQVLIPILLRPIVGLNHEVFYRIVPFLSAVLLSWLYARSIHPRGSWRAVVLGLAAATIPSLYYYSSILYLEMPAVVLMFVVCREADELLSLGFEQLSTRPAWYALILVGFIKETTAAFLLSFVLCRIIFRMKTAIGSMPWKQLVRDELFMAAGTLLPLAIYLFYRSRFGNPRDFSFAPANLLDPRLVLVVLRSRMEQFGLVYLFFLAGIALLAANRQFRKLSFLLATVLSTTLFHLIDAAKYAGYSRFNLFVLPAVLAGSVVFLQFLGSKRKWYLPALAAFALAANLAISPVNWDGTKKPYWGNYLSKTPAEHYYPFPEALEWLKHNQNTPVIQFSGLRISYYLDFYFDKLNWHPQYEVGKDSASGGSASISKALQTASERGFNCVVVIVDQDLPQPLQLDGAARQWQLKVFRNMAHSLLVYTRE